MSDFSKSGNISKTLTGPVYAWRSWAVDRAGFLHSLVHETEQPWTFQARCSAIRSITATQYDALIRLGVPVQHLLPIYGGGGSRPLWVDPARIGHQHASPPVAGCECGLYAYNDPQQWTMVLLNSNQREGWCAHGLVQLHGRALRHEYGWRAERLSPLWLYLEPCHPDVNVKRNVFRSRWRHHQAVADALAQRYHVPVDRAPHWTTTRRREVVDRGVMAAYRQRAVRGEVPPLETVQLHSLAEVYQP